MRSIEFLFHYQCSQCGDSFGRGDRYPLETWHCLSCGTLNHDPETSLHLLMTAEEQQKFTAMLMKWAQDLASEPS